MMPGTGACALSDAVTLTRHAVGLGCGGVLMLPPFYHKGVSDDGLFRYYSEVIERVGNAELRLYLYHIPPVAQVGISLRLIERLLRAWPGVVAGIKDSGGDWENTNALLTGNWDGFSVFSGSEIFLLRNLRAGGAGCISALANVAPSAIERLYREWREPDADAQQHRLVELRNIMHKYPMIAALKAVVAHFGEDPSWTVLRPPLTELSERQRNAVIGDLAAYGLTMPGFPQAMAT
jgi:4-hydroxy-tetrahydrodipicolinate synthase